MYEMRNVHEDRRDDRRRRHDAADPAAKMPDDVVTQVNRLLQVSVSFPPTCRAAGPRGRRAVPSVPGRVAAAVAGRGRGRRRRRASERDMMTPPENFRGHTDLRSTGDVPRLSLSFSLSRGGGLIDVSLPFRDLLFFRVTLGKMFAGLSRKLGAREIRRERAADVSRTI